MIPPKERTIIPPPLGWKERTYYVVRVASHPQNPIHPAIFYSGFLNGKDGGPGGYAAAWNASYDGAIEIAKLHYLMAMSEVGFIDEF